jgi:hypothetical protein
MEHHKSTIRYSVSGKAKGAVERSLGAGKL